MPREITAEPPSSSTLHTIRNEVLSSEARTSKIFTVGASEVVVKVFASVLKGFEKP